MELAQNNLSIQDLSKKVLCYIVRELAHFSPYNRIVICDFLELLVHNESAIYIPCVSVRFATMTLTFQFKFVFLEPHLEVSNDILF